MYPRVSEPALSDRRIDLSELLQRRVSAQPGETVTVERFLLHPHLGLLNELMRAKTPVGLASRTTFVITDIKFSPVLETGVDVSVTFRATSRTADLS